MTDFILGYNFHKMKSVLQPLQMLDLEPLWERTAGGLKPAPAPEAPKHWRWQDIEPLIDGIIDDVPMDQVERRVLTLKNPDQRYALTTTIRNINCGIQILMPGETAPPHRHSPNALRISLEGEGGMTSVNGTSYEMRRGDVILTPSWTTHAHAHQGAERVIWIDFLDVPFYRNLDQIFFETGGSHGAGGKGPRVGKMHDGTLPVGRFPWDAVSAQIAAAAAAGDATPAFEYIDPVIGDSALSTLDCRAIGLSPGEKAVVAASSANAVYLVIEGAGETVIGDTTVSWMRNDLFTLPQWQAAEHRSDGGSAKLICVSDRPVLRRLGLLQELEG
mgnify:FL=1